MASMAFLTMMMLMTMMTILGYAYRVTVMHKIRGERIVMMATFLVLL